MGEQQDRRNRGMLDRALERAGRQPQFGTPMRNPDPLFPVGRSVLPRPAYEGFLSMPLEDIPQRTQADEDAIEAIELYQEREGQRDLERLAQGPFGRILAPITDWARAPETRERIGEGVGHWLEGFSGGGETSATTGDDPNTLGELGDAFGDTARGVVRADSFGEGAASVLSGAARSADAITDWWNEDDNQLSLPWRMGGARSLFSVQPGAADGPLRGYVPAFAEATTGQPWEESDWARRGIQFENARMEAASNNPGQGPVAFDTSGRNQYADEMTAAGIDAGLNLGFGALDASEVLRAPRLLGAADDLAGEIAFYRSPDGFAETSIDPDGRIVHTYQGAYQSGEGSAGEAVASMRAAERALLDDIAQNQRPEYYWRPGPDDGGDPRLAQFYRNAFERRTPTGYSFSEAPDGTMRLSRLPEPQDAAGLNQFDEIINDSEWPLTSANEGVEDDFFSLPRDSSDAQRAQMRAARTDLQPIEGGRAPDAGAGRGGQAPVGASGLGSQPTLDEMRSALTKQTPFMRREYVTMNETELRELYRGLERAREFHDIAQQWRLGRPLEAVQEARPSRAEGRFTVRSDDPGAREYDINIDDGAAVRLRIEREDAGDSVRWDIQASRDGGVPAEGARRTKLGVAAMRGVREAMAHDAQTYRPGRYIFEAASDLADNTGGRDSLYRYLAERDSAALGYRPSSDGNFFSLERIPNAPARGDDLSAIPLGVGAAGGGAVAYALDGEAEAGDGETDENGFPLLPAIGAGAGAGAAFLASRGRGGRALNDSLATPSEPTRLYRGVAPDETRRSALGDRWWSTDPGVASSYAPEGVDGAHVMFGDVDENALNLLNVEPEPGTMFRSIPVDALPPDLREAFPRSTDTVSTHEIAAAAESLGYDGVTFRGIRDSGYGGGAEAYPGFGEGDPGRVVALFDEQAFDARSAPDGASQSDWRQSVISLGAGGAGGAALGYALGDDAEAQDMDAEEALGAYGSAEGDFFGPSYRLVAPRGAVPSLIGAEYVSGRDDLAVLRAGGRTFLVRVSREPGGGDDMAPASLSTQLLGELEANPDVSASEVGRAASDREPAQESDRDWLAARPLISVGAGLGLSRLTRNRMLGPAMAGGGAAFVDSVLGGSDQEATLAGAIGLGGRYLWDEGVGGERVDRALRSPEFELQRDVFAQTLSDEAPTLRAQNTLGEIPMGPGGLTLEPPRAEVAEQGYARDVATARSPRQQFLESSPADQLWWMESADARVADQSALLDDVRSERAALGMDDAFRVAPVLPASETMRAALAPNDSRSFPIGFFDPATGEALFGSAGRRGPPARPRKPFDQLAPAGQARRVGGAPDQIALAQELGLGEFQKGAEAMRAIRERAAADPAFMEMLKTRFPSIAAAILGVGGAVASEVADEGDWLR